MSNADKRDCPRGHRLCGANLVGARLRKGWRECRLCAIARTRLSKPDDRSLFLPDFDMTLQRVAAAHPDIARDAFCNTGPEKSETFFARMLDTVTNDRLTKGMTNTDARLGKYLSVTGVVHTSRGCARRGKNKGFLIDQDSVDYWTERGTEHKFCERCN